MAHTAVVIKIVKNVAETPFLDEDASDGIIPIERAIKNVSEVAIEFAPKTIIDHRLSWAMLDLKKSEGDSRLRFAIGYHNFSVATENLYMLERYLN